MGLLEPSPETSLLTRVSWVPCRYSGILFMIAAIILAASQTIAMIVIGRVFQGVAVR